MTTEATHPRRRRGDEEAFEDWLRTTTERLDPFMAWLGVIFALAVGYEIVAPVRPPATQVLSWAGWIVWAVFLCDFGVKVWLAPSRRRFLRRHWLQAAFLVIPTLRVLSFLRLLRLGRALPGARVLTSSYRAVGTARRVLRSRLYYLAALTTIAVIGVAEAAFLFDGGPGHTFPHFGSALLWSLGVVVGMQGDPIPASTAGKLVMDIGFAVGAVVIAALAGTVGAFLVDNRAERAAAEES